MRVYGKIKRYFEPKPQLTVGTITAKDIEKFYEHLFAQNVVANTVIHYHAILHKAFQKAFKDELIDANPFDRIDRPKKNKFHGENYSEEELVTLLELTRSDSIYPAIMLGGGLGLRRSEALGVRWSRIDWDKKTVLLDTKIIEYKANGKTVIDPVEEMKTKSSRQTLPLPEPVLEMLSEEKEKQSLYRKMFKGSYNRKHDDFVCVNELGELIRPTYVTQHFSDLLKNTDCGISAFTIFGTPLRAFSSGRMYRLSMCQTFSVTAICQPQQISMLTLTKRASRQAQILLQEYLIKQKIDAPRTEVHFANRKDDFIYG